MNGASEEGFVGLPGGGALAYAVHGAQHHGVPLLLVRPLGGSMTTWGPFRTRLAETMRVVSFDLRGTGRSTPDPRWVDTAKLAEDCLRVLARLSIPRAHVFGLSLGGMVATWLAILAPASVANVCIASAPARGLELTRAGIGREVGLASCLLHPLHEIEARLVDRILSRRFRDAHPDEVRAIEDGLSRETTSRRTLFAHATAALLHDARRELPRIEAPTLVLAGQCDELLGADAPEALARGIRGASFEILPDCGHDLTLEQPELTATRLAAFVLPP